MKQVSEHFTVPEFVPKELYLLYGGLCIRYINMKLVAIAEILRAFYKVPVTINDYYRGGDHDGRCYRLPSDPAYRKGSDHSDNMALDFSVDGIDSLKVQSDVLNQEDFNQALIEAGVTGMEDGTIGWTHLGISDLTLWSMPEKNGIKLIPIPKAA
jgi:hypothetical protein